MTTKCKGQYTLPELHDNRLIEWKLHVTKSLGAYDMIIGRDILQDLGIDLQFSMMKVSWDGHEIPFKEGNCKLEDSYFVQDPEVIKDAAEWLKTILDAKYKAADLRKVADSATHLEGGQREALHQLLNKYAPLFNGTLGTWTGSKYNIELKPGATPYHAKAFPIP